MNVLIQWAVDRGRGMSNLPYMQMWWPDYLADTTHLSVEEHGAYLLLLGWAWMNGGRVPNDDTKLAYITRCSVRCWRKIAPTVRAFFTIGDGF
jgi:uncharacterized protein YdaU (DUF1376 family)